MQILDFLVSNNISLAVSFYIANKLSTLEVQGDKLHQIDAPIARPTGFFVLENGIYLAHQNGISFLNRFYYESEERYFYREKSSLLSGYLDSHELVCLGDRPIFCNTRFGILSSLSQLYDFSIFYQPSFTSELAPEDRSHLNGVAIKDGLIKYISCFSPSCDPGIKSWGKRPHTGAIWDVIEDREVVGGLSLPHSPRCYDGKLYFCNSGRGELVEFPTGKILQLKGITRGMAIKDGIAIVGVSKVREANTNPQIERELLEDKCGLVLIDLAKWEILDKYFFNQENEIFDIQIIPDHSCLLTATTPPSLHLHLYART